MELSQSPQETAGMVPDGTEPPAPGTRTAVRQARSKVRGLQPEDPMFAERYRAIAARDRRFDGQFVTAVHSTGIYCRPSCPARTPKPQNVSFFGTSAAAHAAGFRACRRCLPEAVPGSPLWDARHDVSARAMRLIRDGLVDRDGVTGLAAALGYTPRHLNRVLVAELGAGPVALARAARAQTARQLITHTGLTLADVAFASGFGSVRQFNTTVMEVFGMTPAMLRSRAGRPPAAPLAATTHPATTRPVSAAPAGPPGVGHQLLSLTLPLREPYDAPGIMTFLAARAITGVECADPVALTYARTVALPGGPGAFRAQYHPRTPGHLLVEVELTTLTDLPAAISRVRRLFDLDADPIAVDHVLESDPALTPAVAATPGIRVPGAVDGTEMLMRALIGQQISVAAARTHLSRLAVLGSGFSSRLGPTRLFPDAAQVVAHGRGHLRGPGRRIDAIINAATAIASGDLVLSPAADPHRFRAHLLALPGVGQWTADYLALRIVHDPDVLPATDGALLAGATALGLCNGGPPARRSAELAARGAAWAPWRSYAAMHVWRAAATQPPTMENET